MIKKGDVIAMFTVYDEILYQVQQDFDIQELEREYYADRPELVRVYGESGDDKVYHPKTAHYGVEGFIETLVIERKIKELRAIMTFDTDNTDHQVYWKRRAYRSTEHEDHSAVDAITNAEEEMFRLFKKENKNA
jgi:hypothetical protein